MLFFHPMTKVEFICRMCKVLRSNISSESNSIYLSLCCLSCHFSYFSITREVDTWDSDLDLKARKRSKDLLAGRNNIEFLAILPARRGPVYAAMPAFGITWKVFVDFL